MSRPVRPSCRGGIPTLVFVAPAAPGLAFACGEVATTTTPEE